MKRGKFTPPQRTVLDHLRQSGTPLNATDIGNAVDFPRIGTARILQQLELRNAVVCVTPRIPSGPNACEPTWKARTKR